MWEFQGRNSDFWIETAVVNGSGTVFRVRVWDNSKFDSKNFPTVPNVKKIDSIIAAFWHPLKKKYNDNFELKMMGLQLTLNSQKSYQIKNAVHFGQGLLESFGGWENESI